MEVSRSGFYDQGKKAQRPRRQQDALLAQRIEGLFFQSRQTYGCLRLQHALRQQDIRCGKNRIGRHVKVAPCEVPGRFKEMIVPEGQRDRSQVRSAWFGVRNGVRPGGTADGRSVPNLLSS
jgi:hypothetical protein